MQLGELSAVVCVDGGLLPEYAVEYSADGMEATCWIASEKDKKFSVKMENTETLRTISCDVMVDGIKCGCSRLRDLSGTGVSTACRSSVSTSANTRRPLTFSQQILTDDDAYLDVAISPDLGTIKVVFKLVKPLDGQGVYHDQRWRNICEPPIKVHERSKKGMGHSVQFGPEYHSPNISHLSSRTIKVLATFVFKYRPIELLRAQGIAPPAEREERAATPTGVVNLSMEVDEEDADEAEIKKLEMKLNALKNKKKQVKRAPDVKKEIKSEEPIFKPGEVIDLT